MKARFGYILLWLSAVPASVLRFNIDAAEYWCARVLPQVRAHQASLSSLIAFPLCDLIIFLLAATALLCAAKRTFLPYIAAFLIFSFALTWTAPCALSQVPDDVSPEQLRSLCGQLSEEAAYYQAQERRFDRDKVLIDAAALCSSPIVPKECSFPAITKGLGIAGWWSPLTAEAVVDGTMGELNLPFTACHELMHARGVASESYANYLAYLACMQGDGAFRYSGTMNALWYAMRALRTEDPAAWQQVLSGMDRCVYADFKRMNGLSEAPVGALTAVQNAATGLYLRISGADDYDGFASWLVYRANFA